MVSGKNYSRASTRIWVGDQDNRDEADESKGVKVRVFSLIYMHLGHALDTDSFDGSCSRPRFFL